MWNLNIGECLWGNIQITISYVLMATTLELYRPYITWENFIQTGFSWNKRKQPVFLFLATAVSLKQGPHNSPCHVTDKIGIVIAFWLLMNDCTQGEFHHWYLYNKIVLFPIIIFLAHHKRTKIRISMCAVLVL